ncbi:MAG: hypothetical protein VX656_06625 [Candidatus Latescibacterota bacterium]|nr:hypothetical protein [Candidatus Latescibacterota bacterium]
MITGITRGPVDLVTPPDGDNFRYGLGFPMQIGPRQAALLCNLRTEQMPTGDFENGADVLLFDDIDEISETVAVPITRNERTTHPETDSPRIIVKYPIVGGFVPYGARRADGQAHPCAGTGFGVSEALDFPMLPDGSYSKADKTKSMVRRAVVHQLTFDGRAFTAHEDRADNDLLAVPESDWIVYVNGLHTAIPDGDDLLYPACATTGDASLCWPTPTAAGVCRWQFREDRWQLSHFEPVAMSRQADEPRILYDEPVELAAAEPSLVRDHDGSLLFTARMCGDDEEDHVIRVWRSSDGGRSWSTVIEQSQARGQAPITINRASDGTVYLAANALDRERDLLWLWPLNEQRTGLLEGMEIRDALEEFGPPPTGPVWFMDHPTAVTLRLGDGQWHHILVCRLMDRGEHAGAAPPPQTGMYVEEVTSSGPAIPEWHFED